VFNLYVNTLDEESDDDSSAQVDESNETVTGVTIEYCSGDGMNISDQELELYNKVRRKIESENVAVVDREQTLEKKRIKLRKKIKSQMDSYKDYCRKIKMGSYLEDNGNDLYKSMVANKTIDTNKIKFENALYVSKFFDAAKWWMKHESKYPELAMGASIMLGKPSHNAFQERVFSRGTYADTKLRKKLKEEYFEMSVLNAVNDKQIDDIYHIMQPTIMLREKDKQQEMKAFMEQRKNELDLLKQIDIVEDNDGKKEAEPEYGSVCSDFLEDDGFSDDEEEDDFSIKQPIENFISVDDE
jgi:hypothetical protein